VGRNFKSANTHRLNMPMRNRDFFSALRLEILFKNFTLGYFWILIYFIIALPLVQY
jgi:hypothetical protein